MWDGPYGDWGSKKYLVASLNQSLKRMGLEYVDIFYHHRPDPETPLEETMAALDQIVRQGKALYVGLSNYPAERARQAFAILKDLGTPCLIHQPKYSMFERWVEADLLDTLAQSGVGSIAFSPLAGGVLTDRKLNAIAEARGQKLSQMALAWVLRGDKVTSVLIGASKTSQIDDAVGMISNRHFSEKELADIEAILV